MTEPLPGPVLLNGASGFIGQALLHELQAMAADVATLSWREGDLSVPALRENISVVHLAGLAHAGAGRYSRDDYQRVNTQYPVALAQQAIAAGARRFIFVSSVKAAAYEQSRAYNDETCIGVPDDAYGWSKHQAEQQLQALDWQQCSLTIVRPALVIGPAVKGNMALLQQHAVRPWFPMIAGGGQRSLLMLPDLLDLLLLLLKLPRTASPCYIASSEHLAIDAQIAAIRAAAALPPARWQLPATLLRSALSLADVLTAGKLLLNEKADKMLARECYSAERAGRELNWYARCHLAETLSF